MRTLSKGHGRWATKIAVSMVILIVLGGFSGPWLASGQVVKTTVTLALSPEKGYIDPGVNASSTIFTGKVTVKSFPLIITTVNVTSNAGQWTNETSAQNLVINGNREQTFTVKVYAPYNATVGEIQVVRVMIKWTNTLNEKGGANATAEAVVNQSYSLTNYISKTIYVYPGKSDKTQAYIGNTGNGPDTVSITLVNNSDLLHAGWTFSLSKTSMNLDPDGSDSVQLTVNIPATAPVKVSKFAIRATSDGAKASGKDYFTDANVTVSVMSPGSGGGGGGGGGTKTNNTSKPACVFGLIPIMIVPLGTTMIGLRFVRDRVRRRDGWD